MDFIKFKIDKKYEGWTIREILLNLHLGKEKIYNYELNKSFMINSKFVTQREKCHEGDELEIFINENIDIAPCTTPIKVLFENNNYLFVYKPRGILVHSDGVENHNTLANMVANYFKEHHIRRKVRFSHRIDVATEGIVVFSKNDLADAYLNYQIEQRNVLKKYYAICYNRFSKNEGIIETPIARDRHNSKKMITNPHGLSALTEYKVLKNGKISLVDVTLHTGRTHQIRVHMASINHPLLGDELYGVVDEHKLMLQAYRFKFFSALDNKELDIQVDLSLNVEGK